MIEKREILKFSTSTGVPVSTIEKDYALGWFLASIQNHRSLSDTWIFKGGTCLKKCYFDDYRFSEDLDFSLLDSSQMTSAFLKTAFSDISSWVYEAVGLEISEEETSIDVYKNRRGNINVQASIKFCGPLQQKSKSCWPRIKFDLTADEKIVKNPENKNVFHPYSDIPVKGISVKAYPIEELFAEKLRALSERCRPRDLYDVIMLYKKRDHFLLAPKSCLSILEEKCRFKSIDTPSFFSIETHKEKEVLNAQWTNMLQHQISNLPPSQTFWKELSSLFLWLKGEK